MSFPHPFPPELQAMIWKAALPDFSPCAFDLTSTITNDAANHDEEETLSITPTTQTKHRIAAIRRLLLVHRPARHTIEALLPQILPFTGGAMRWSAARDIYAPSPTTSYPDTTHLPPPRRTRFPHNWHRHIRNVAIPHYEAWLTSLLPVDLLDPSLAPASDGSPDHDGTATTSSSNTTAETGLEGGGWLLPDPPAVPLADNIRLAAWAHARGNPIAAFAFWAHWIATRLACFPHLDTIVVQAPYLPGHGDWDATTTTSSTCTSSSNSSRGATGSWTAAAVPVFQCCYNGHSLAHRPGARFTSTDAETFLLLLSDHASFVRWLVGTFADEDEEEGEGRLLVPAVVAVLEGVKRALPTGAVEALVEARVVAMVERGHDGGGMLDDGGGWLLDWEREVEYATRGRRVRR